jgi:hypothetical protein
MFGSEFFESIDNEFYFSNDQENNTLNQIPNQIPDPFIFNWIPPMDPYSYALLNSEESEEDKERYLIERNKINDSMNGKTCTSEEKKIQFKVESNSQKNNPRGRKSINANKKSLKVHDKLDIDNIISVVQAHYMNFIVDIINCMLKLLGEKRRFSKISYDIKKKVNKKNFEALKEKKLYEILLFDISPKFTRAKIDHNKVLYENIKDLNIFKELLNQNYLTFFRNVYYKSERKLNLIIDGKNMTFDLNDEKLSMYKDKIAGFSDKNYLKLFEKYVQERYL